MRDDTWSQPEYLWTKGVTATCPLIPIAILRLFAKLDRTSGFRSDDFGAGHSLCAFRRREVLGSVAFLSLRGSYRARAIDGISARRRSDQSPAVVLWV